MFLLVVSTSNSISSLLEEAGGVTWHGEASSVEAEEAVAQRVMNTEEAKFDFISSALRFRFAAPEAFGGAITANQRTNFEAFLYTFQCLNIQVNRFSGIQRHSHIRKSSESATFNQNFDKEGLILWKHTCKSTLIWYFLYCLIATKTRAGVRGSRQGANPGFHLLKEVGTLSSKMVNITIMSE